MTRTGPGYGNVPPEDDQGVFEPPAPRLGGDGEGASPRGALARLFVRGPWEMAASILIGLGVVMLMQPFFLWAYTWSFVVLLVGTVGFIVVSHFPEGR